MTQSDDHPYRPPLPDTAVAGHSVGDDYWLVDESEDGDRTRWLKTDSPVVLIQHQ